MVPRSFVRKATDSTAFRRLSLINTFMTKRVSTSRRRAFWTRAAFTIIGLTAGTLLIATAWLFVQLRASLPRLEGSITAPSLSAPVTVVRDAQGVPTLTGRARADLAWALGYRIRVLC
jgi:hypothetical protein